MVQANVGDQDEVQRMVSEVRDALGPIIILVLAGLSIVEHATDVTWETWRRTMDVNLDGTFHVVYAPQGR
ncbi:MAG: SDR family NAD(P)-dependent oxidoreductase [Planctomycetaceae bacterium]